MKKKSVVLAVWHTRRWYLENFGVDPVKLNLKCETVKNPHFSSAAPMKLWKEEDVFPFKSDEGVQNYVKRKDAGHKAFQTRKRHLVEWWKKIKAGDPQVQEIVKRLWTIGEEIGTLHGMKERCRSGGWKEQHEAYWEYGEEHCLNCAQRSGLQEKLREERARLFSELEELCEKDKVTIQIARRYYRVEQQVNTVSEPSCMEV